MVNPFKRYMDVEEIRRKERDKTKLTERQYWLNEIKEIKEAARLQHNDEKYDIRVEANRVINGHKREINELHRQLNNNRQALSVTRDLTVSVFAHAEELKDFVGVKYKGLTSKYQKINTIYDGLEMTLKQLADYSDKFDKAMGEEDLAKNDELEVDGSGD